MENLVNKKRIAICFFGQTRTSVLLNEVYRNLNRLSDKFQFDFFASTWDDFENKSCFDFFTDKEFIKKELPWHDSDGWIKPNSQRMAVTLAKTNQLKANYELNNCFVYDYVVYTRSDYYYNIDIFLEILEERSKNPTKYQIDLLDDMVEDEDGYNYLHNDILLMGTSLAFDLYCTGWKSYYMSGESKKYKHGGHNFHAYNISENNLDYSKSLEKLGNGAQVLFEKQRWEMVNEDAEIDIDFKKLLKEIREHKKRVRKGLMHGGEEKGYFPSLVKK
jgi:hypothetical protein|tara:strand:+ start:247 stop:1071 length:825 start_codon:yes stop_codon:yes gene_type:complete